MDISSIGINAYKNAMELRRRSVDNTVTERLKKPQAPRESFSDTLKGSLKTVNDMQEQKNAMIEEFASGKNQNVHELMISLQKAGLAVNMTSAVRNKLMTAYQEMMRLQF
ncbi:flagellar hook-basal body complex protein FliE [Pseudodesulfovibrio sp.]|uniref:flagellar hook-basal body complex protein FliE n=1 Tax=unclassified Pseudodesulfovibrio TaxID=2661612 RepID=UPI003AFFC250